MRAPKVEEVLDTTVSNRLNTIHMRNHFDGFAFPFQGAGDAFVGALAHYSARYPEASLLKKVAGAVTIASMSVQQYGTQNSYPWAKDLRFDINLKSFDWSYV